MMMTTTMREHYGYISAIVVFSLWLGSLSTDSFVLVSPQSSRAAAFSANSLSTRHQSSHSSSTAARIATTTVSLQGAGIPYFAANSETVLVKEANKQQQKNNKNDDNDDDDDEQEFDPYAKLGIQEDALAISINPEEVLKYIGTREDLIQKTLSDIPKMQRAQAETEVDKFLLDAEALQIFIEFQKRKEADPDFVVPKDTTEQEEGLFSLRNIVFIYLAYVAYSSGPIDIRNYVQSQIEAGSWKGTGIPQLDEWLLQVPAATADAVDAVTTTVTTTTAVDAVWTDTAVSAAASDAVSAVSDTVLQAAQLVSLSLFN